jgi:hypothetical protein
MLQAMQSPTNLVRVCLNCWAVHKNGFTGQVPEMPFPALVAAPSAMNPYAGGQVAPQRAVSSQQAPQKMAGSVVLALPPGEYFDGPIGPLNPGPLPTFPGKTALEKGDLFGMTKMSFAMMGSMLAHKNDPHLSREENAMGLAKGIQSTSGITGQQNQLVSALQLLQDVHMPDGLAGFVVTEPPAKGTLAQAYGLQVYDLIYGFESTLATKDTRPQQFAQDMQSAFVTKGVFVILIYSFASQKSRRVHIIMPPGKPNAILGIVSSQLPINTEAIPGVINEASMDIYVKAWRRNGNMYISAGSNAVPLYAPLSSENEGLYVKVARHNSGMWISTNDYHPLYNYTTLTEPLYVEVWRYRNGMLIKNGSEYAPLPKERISAAPSMMPASVPISPQGQQQQQVYQQMMMPQQQQQQQQQQQAYPQQQQMMMPQQQQQQAYPQQQMMMPQQQQQQQQAYPQQQQQQVYPQQQMTMQQQQQQVYPPQQQPLQNNPYMQGQSSQLPMETQQLMQQVQGMAGNSAQQQLEAGAGMATGMNFYSPQLQQQQMAQLNASGHDFSAIQQLQSQYSATGVPGMPTLNTAEGIPANFGANDIQAIIASSNAAAAAASASADQVPQEESQSPVPVPSEPTATEASSAPSTEPTVPTSTE